MTTKIDNALSCYTQGYQPTEETHLNLQQAAAQIREKLSSILSLLSYEEHMMHHKQIENLMYEYDELAKHHEIAASEIVIALVGCAFGIVSAGFDDKGSASRALSGVASFLNKGNDLVQGLNESKKSEINAKMRLLELQIQDLNKTGDNTTNFKRDLLKMMENVADIVARIIEKCG